MKQNKTANKVSTKGNATKQSNETTKQSKSVAKNSPIIPLSSKVTYLAEGISGKELQSRIIDANNRFKKEIGGYMYCLKKAVKHGEDSKMFDALKYVTASDFLAPKLNEEIRLVNFLTDSEKERVNKDKENFPNGKYSVWLLLSLIKRYAKSIKK